MPFLLVDGNLHAAIPSVLPTPVAVALKKGKAVHNFLAWRFEPRLSGEDFVLQNRMSRNQMRGMGTGEDVLLFSLQTQTFGLLRRSHLFTPEWMVTEVDCLQKVYGKDHSAQAKYQVLPVLHGALIESLGYYQPQKPDYK